MSRTSQCRRIAQSQRRCRVAWMPGLILASTVTTLIGLAWSRATAQSNGELPSPRLLPPEMQQPPACPRAVPAHPSQAESRSDQTQSQRLSEAIEQLRHERGRLRQIRQQPVVLPRQEEISSTDALQRQVQRLLIQWMLEGTASPAPAHTGHATEQHPPSGPSSNPSALAPRTSTAPGFEPTFPTSAGPTTQLSDTPRAASNNSAHGAGSRLGTNPPSPGPGSQSGPMPQPTPAKLSNSATGLATGESEKPLAPMELAQVLFQAGNYEAALAAFQLVNVSQLSREDRLLVQYLQACCLRRLDRKEEANKLLREIANSRTNSFAVECARWQLVHWHWQQEMLRRLEQLRARRENP